MELVKTDIRNLSRDEIKTYLVELGESAFRAKQVYSWIWQKSAKSFDEMTNLSKELRETLKSNLLRFFYKDLVGLSKAKATRMSL